MGEEGSTGMPTVQTQRHPDDLDLGWEQVSDAVARLEGSWVNVRIIERSEPEELLAVFRGTLGELSRAKQPTLFWPIFSDGGAPAAAQEVQTDFQRDPDHLECVGFYLRRDRFEGALGRAGGTVLAIIQGPVLISIRRS